MQATRTVSRRLSTSCRHESSPCSRVMASSSAQPDPAGLGGVDVAQVHAADRDQEDENRLPHARQGAHPLPPGRDAGGHGRDRRVQLRPDHDDRHEQSGQDQPGQDAGDQQLADGLLGDHPVDDEPDAGRDEEVDRRPGGHDAGRELGRVAVAPHLRDDGLAEGGRGGDRGAADGREARDGHDGRDPQPPGPAPEPRVEGAVEARGDPGGVREPAHEDEERDDGEGVGGGGLVHRARKQGQRRARAGEHPDTGGPHEHQRKGDRHPQEDQQHHEAAAEYADQDRVHPPPPSEGRNGIDEVEEQLAPEQARADAHQHLERRARDPQLVGHPGLVEPYREPLPGQRADDEQAQEERERLAGGPGPRPEPADDEGGRDVPLRLLGARGAEQHGRRQQVFRQLVGPGHGLAEKIPADDIGRGEQHERQDDGRGRPGCQPDRPLDHPSHAPETHHPPPVRSA